MLALAACGGPATTPTSKGQPAVFPVTITRTGGLAGFRDILVVNGDGLVSVTRKGQAARHCRLTPDAFKRLTTATNQMTWSSDAPASTQPSFPDDLVTLVLSPAGGPVRLADPKAGVRGQVFHELLNDLTGDPASTRMCKPA